jgi:hypothetical protein
MAVLTGECGGNVLAFVTLVADKLSLSFASGFEGCL